MSNSAEALPQLVGQYLEFKAGAEVVMRRYDEDPTLDPKDMTFEEKVWLRGYLMLETQGDVDDISRRGEYE